MKGAGVTILIAFLIIIGTGIFLTRMISSLQEPKTGQRELTIKEDIYFFRDSLELAKLYLDNAARLSLSQAMIDNGRRGGLDRKESIWTMIYGGTNYTLLYNNSDIFPTEDELTEYLEDTTRRHFTEYTRNKDIKSFFVIQLPDYNEVVITKADDYNVRFQGAALDLSITMTTDNKDEITVQKSSSIDLNIYAPYYLLHRAALEIHEDLKGKLRSCDKAAIERTADEFLYNLDVEVLDSDDSLCLVKVNVTSRNRYLVWTGTNSTLSEISIVFLERLGTPTERCGDCMSTLGTWCVQSELCSTNTEDVDCPDDSVIKTTSCKALEQISCDECLGNSPSPIDWLWCLDLSGHACAETCNDKTVYNPEEC